MKTLFGWIALLSIVGYVAVSIDPVHMTGKTNGRACTITTEDGTMYHVPEDLIVSVYSRDKYGMAYYGNAPSHFADVDRHQYWNPTGGGWETSLVKK